MLLLNQSRRLLTFALFMSVAPGTICQAQSSSDERAPRWYKVPNGGQTLAEVLTTACRTSTLSTLSTQVTERFLTLNGGGDLNRRIATGALVAIPPCFRYVAVVVKSGDTIGKLLMQHRVVPTPTAVRKVFELSRGTTTSTSVESFSKTLRIGSLLKLPITNSIPPTEGSDPPPDPAVEPSPPDVVDSFPNESPPPGLEYVQFMSSPEAAAHGCSNAGPAFLPFDAALLKRIVQSQRQQALRYFDSLPPIVVGLIDSGINGVGRGLFQESRLAPNYHEKYGVKGKDDDLPTNGRVDDIYGFNFNHGPNAGSIVYYPQDTEREHGTRIGTLVLGGTAWANEWSGELPQLTRLRVINFSEDTTSGLVDAANLGIGVSRLSDDAARVVNMSLSTRDDIPGLNGYIRSARRTLIVAAAGNLPTGGRDLKSYPQYPALYGGDDSTKTVLTVGAHNERLQLAGFSNYSDSRVDLLAPGCMVPTMNIAGNEVLEHGTSVAAAIASFAASLVASLGEDRPEAVKRRLVFSVDADDALKDKVRSIGRLNIAKAVLLFEDVVEIKSATNTLLHGRLEDVASLGRFCADDNIRVRLGDFRKVRPNIYSGGIPYIEYWRDEQGHLQRERCQQKDSSLSIGNYTVDGSQGEGPALQDVVDIVIADYRALPP
jgi:hypothetical protein